MNGAGCMLTSLSDVLLSLVVAVGTGVSLHSQLSKLNDDGVLLIQRGFSLTRGCCSVSSNHESEDSAACAQQNEACN